MDDPMYCALEGSVHIVGEAETTLCGNALEGEEGETAALNVVPQRITCERCKVIIEYVKAIPNKYHHTRRRPQRTNRFDSLGRY